MLSDNIWYGRVVMSGPAPTDSLRSVTDSGEQAVYYHDRQRTYHTWWDDANYEPVSTALLTALSSIQGLDPDELESLWTYVDPDALNALVSHWNRSDSTSVTGSVSFCYSEYEITIRSDGEIVIDPPQA